MISSRKDIEKIIGELRPELIYFHSYEKVLNCFSKKLLSESQIQTFTREMFDGLHEGLTPSEVNQPWFKECHVRAARKRLPKEEFLTEELSSIHMNILSEGVSWNRIKRFTAAELNECKALPSAQYKAIMLFDLSKDQVNQPWFDCKTLDYLTKGMSFEDAAVKSKVTYTLPSRKFELVKQQEITFKEAQLWLLIPEIRISLLVIANNLKAQTSKNPNDLIIHILSFLAPKDVNVAQLFKKLHGSLVKSDSALEGVATASHINLTRFGFFQVSSRTKSQCSTNSTSAHVMPAPF